MKIEKLFVRDSTNETPVELNLYYDKELKKLVYRDYYGNRVEVGTGSGGGSTSFTDINVIFVSPNGDDNNDGSIAKPVKSLVAGKNLANSGDLVYVFPGTWTFDNRNSAGNPFNTDQNTKLNLWKNGVKYYFSPGTRIEFINQTVTGSTMALFRPVGGAYETCSVYGQLEFSSYSEGTNSFNGRAVFFQENAIGTNFGYEFNAEVKSLISTSAEVIVAEGTSTVDPAAQPNKITLKADVVQKYYLGGQSGSGSVILLIDANKSNTSFTFREFNGFQNTTDFNLSNGIRLQNTASGSIINLTVDTANLRSQLLWVRCPEVTANVNTLQGYLGDRLFVLDSLGSGTFNISGNYNITTSSVLAVLDTKGAGNSRITFRGNIYTNITSGIGKTIIDNVLNTLIFEGSVNYLGTTNTASALISNNGTVIFSGTITGSLNGSLCSNQAGGVTTFQGVTAKLTTPDSRISDGGFGTTSISNCIFILGGSGGGVFSAISTTVVVTNSSIKSLNGRGFFNNSSAGGLNLINSTIITAGTNLAVEFTGVSPVNIANSSSNNAVSAVTLNGAITTVTNLNIA